MGALQEIEKLAALGITKLPRSLARRFGKPETVDGQVLDPHLRILFALNKRRGGFETMGTVSAARQSYLRFIDALERPEPATGLIRDRKVETEHGAVRIRLYEAAAPGPRPCIVYFHGGGYAIGDLETHDGLCRRFSRELEATVVAVDYRLAPDDPFPAGLNDCLSVTRWVIESATSLDIDASRIALAGDSAGGNFAAVISQEVAGIAFQLLIYPGTDARSQLPSKRLFATGYGLDKSTIDWFFQQYAEEADRENPRVSPAASERLERSPPTHVATAGFDVLRDEGRAFARLLQEAGVPCTLENHSSLSHGFVHFTRVPACNDAVAKLIAVLRSEL